MEKETLILRTKRDFTAPPDAFQLTEDEAYFFQKSFIRKWPSGSEVFFLKYGSLIAGAMSAVSCGIITAYFRRAVKLDIKGVLATSVPGVMVPGYLGYVITDKTLVRDTLLMKEKCPVCTQLKYTTQIFGTSIFYPTLYSCITSCLYIVAKKAIPAPDAANFHSLVKISYALVRGCIPRKYPVVGVLQTAVCLTLPYMVNKEFSTISSSIAKAASDLGFFKEGDLFQS